MINRLKKKLLDGTGVIRYKYRLCIAACVVSILLAGTIYLYYHNPEEGLFIACPVYAWTGYYCPGCGAGRACYNILHGRFYQAFRYNPMLLFILPWLGMYYLICGIQWLKDGRERLSVRIPAWIPLTVLILFLIYGAVRNIDMYPFRLLAPAKI